MNTELSIEIDRREKGVDIPTLIVDQIVAQISEGRLKPGDKLPSELNMTRRFGISRVTIREAMRLLEAKGYITSFGKQGRFIKSVTDSIFFDATLNLFRGDPSSFKHLLEFKQTLYPRSAACAARRGTPDELEKTRQLFAEVSKAEREGISMIDGYFAFLRHLSETSRNPIFMHMMDTTISISRLMSQESDLWHTVHSKKECFVRTLGQVAVAVCEGRADDAEMLMTTHLECVEVLLVPTAQN